MLSSGAFQGNKHHCCPIKASGRRCGAGASRHRWIRNRLITRLIRIHLHPFLQPLVEGKRTAARLRDAQVLAGFGDHVVHLAAEEAQLDGATPAFALFSSNAVRNQPEFTCVLGQNLAYRNSESGFVRIQRTLTKTSQSFSGSHPKSDASRNQLPRYCPYLLKTWLLHP